MCNFQTHFICHCVPNIMFAGCVPSLSTLKQPRYVIFLKKPADTVLRKCLHVYNKKYFTPVLYTSSLVCFCLVCLRFSFLLFIWLLFLDTRSACKISRLYLHQFDQKRWHLTHHANQPICNYYSYKAPGFESLSTKTNFLSVVNTFFLPCKYWPPEYVFIICCVSLYCC